MGEIVDVAVAVTLGRRYCLGEAAVSSIGDRQGVIGVASCGRQAR